jgi:GT2 family glycosyltransferase
MPKVTICILTYGEHLHLARRAIESVVAHCPRNEYELVIGANAVAEDTRAYFEQIEAAGEIDHLISSPLNINKCPMMRRMFDRASAGLIWWFDDDSYITDERAWPEWVKAAESASPDIAMWGELYRCNTPADFTDSEDIVGFIRKAAWYRGLPPPSWRCGGKGEFNFENRNCGDGRWDFIVGGCWLIRASAVRALDWPDPRLVKLGDDVLLGEAIRQHGWKLGNIGSAGVAINTEPRRGSAGSCNAPQTQAHAHP